MNPLDLTIDQFQRIVAIQAAGVIPEPQLKAAAVAICLNTSVEEVNKMSMSKVNEIYKPLKEFQLPQLKYNKHIKIGKAYYEMSLYADEIKTGQLLELFGYNTTNEVEVVADLHKILATLSRRCKFYKWFPENYNGSTHAERAELFQKNVTLRQAWGVVSFFLLLSQPLLNVLATYSNKTMTKMTGKE